jgi:hypothetical protein
LLNQVITVLRKDDFDLRSPNNSRRCGAENEASGLSWNLRGRRLRSENDIVQNDPRFLCWLILTILTDGQTDNSYGWNRSHFISYFHSDSYFQLHKGGHYPAFFKVARVRPVFKSEDPTEFSNYRPISVLPVLSQLFERVLQERLVGFMGQQGVITPGQYGFRAGHSTAMAIIDMVERVRGAWSGKNVALGVFIDLKKAFDTVDHEVLLAKLEHYGVRGGALELLASYLRDRFQYVVYNGGESGRHRVECGVP